MENLASYLPAVIIQSVASENSGLVPKNNVSNVHFTSCKNCVVLFADVSGFTALCEKMVEKYPRGGGDEFLAKHLNSYLELLIRILCSEGGDIIKFAGDALLVIFSPSDDGTQRDEREIIASTVQRAAQCALEIKSKLADADLGSHDNKISLNIKIGIGVGQVNILHVGGVFGRMEYLAAGAPLVQAFNAEHQASKKDVVLSQEAWSYVEHLFNATSIAGVSHNNQPTRYYFLSNAKRRARKVFVRPNFNTLSGYLDSVMKMMSNYIPGAVVPWVFSGEDKFASELRKITVLFVNVGLSEDDLMKISADSDINLVQQILIEVQKAVYRYEGSLNKFLMDDKGSTLIAVFGLPPLAHEDDAVRGVHSALAIVQSLRKLGLHPFVGVTTGVSFCGVVGSKLRREYGVLGDTVNLSARLMQCAGAWKVSVLVDQTSFSEAYSRIQFHPFRRVLVKGKTKPVNTYIPVFNSLNSVYANSGIPPQIYQNTLANVPIYHVRAMLHGNEYLPVNKQDIINNIIKYRMWRSPSLDNVAISGDWQTVDMPVDSSKASASLSVASKSKVTSSKAGASSSPFGISNAFQSQVASSTPSNPPINATSKPDFPTSMPTEIITMQSRLLPTSVSQSFGNALIQLNLGPNSNPTINTNTSSSVGSTSQYFSNSTDNSQDDQSRYVSVVVSVGNIHEPNRTLSSRPLTLPTPVVIDNGGVSTSINTMLVPRQPVLSSHITLTSPEDPNASSHSSMFNPLVPRLTPVMEADEYLNHAPALHMCKFYASPLQILQAMDYFRHTQTSHLLDLSKRIRSLQANSTKIQKSVGTDSDKSSVDSNIRIKSVHVDGRTTAVDVGVADRNPTSQFSIEEVNEEDESETGSVTINNSDTTTLLTHHIDNVQRIPHTYIASLSNIMVMKGDNLSNEQVVEKIKKRKQEQIIHFKLEMMVESLKDARRHCIAESEERARMDRERINNTFTSTSTDTDIFSKIVNMTERDKRKEEKRSRDNEEKARKMHDKNKRNHRQFEEDMKKLKEHEEKVRKAKTDEFYAKLALEYGSFKEDDVLEDIDIDMLDKLHVLLRDDVFNNPLYSYNEGTTTNPTNYTNSYYNNSFNPNSFNPNTISSSTIKAFVNAANEGEQLLDFVETIMSKYIKHNTTNPSDRKYTKPDHPLLPLTNTSVQSGYTVAPINMLLQNGLNTVGDLLCMVAYNLNVDRFSEECRRDQRQDHYYEQMRNKSDNNIASCPVHSVYHKISKTNDQHAALHTPTHKSRPNSPRSSTNRNSVNFRNLNKTDSARAASTPVSGFKRLGKGIRSIFTNTSDDDYNSDLAELPSPTNVTANITPSSSPRNAQSSIDIMDSLSMYVDTVMDDSVPVRQKISSLIHYLLRDKYSDRGIQINKEMSELSIFEEDEFANDGEEAPSRSLEGFQNKLYDYYEDSDLMLGVTYTAFNDIAMKSFKNCNGLLDYHTRHEHVIQPIILPKTIPLTMLLPLLYPQNARTCKFLNYDITMDRGLQMMGNETLSLVLMRMPKDTIDHSYLCRLRDIVVSASLRCVNMTIKIKYPDTNVVTHPYDYNMSDDDVSNASTQSISLKAALKTSIPITGSPNVKANPALLLTPTHAHNANDVFPVGGGLRHPAIGSLCTTEVVPIYKSPYYHGCPSESEPGSPIHVNELTLGTNLSSKKRKNSKRNSSGSDSGSHSVFSPESDVDINPSIITPNIQEYHHNTLNPLVTTDEDIAGPVSTDEFMSVGDVPLAPLLSGDSFYPKGVMLEDQSQFSQFFDFDSNAANMFNRTFTFNEMERMYSGRGSMVLITGNTGLGKTKLLDMIVETSLLPTVAITTNSLENRRYSLLSAVFLEFLEQEVALYETVHTVGVASLLNSLPSSELNSYMAASAMTIEPITPIPTPDELEARNNSRRGPAQNTRNDRRNNTSNSSKLTSMLGEGTSEKPEIIRLRDFANPSESSGDVATGDVLTVSTDGTSDTSDDQLQQVIKKTNKSSLFGYSNSAINALGVSPTNDSSPSLVEDSNEPTSTSMSVSSPFSASAEEKLINMASSITFNLDVATTPTVPAVLSIFTETEQAILSSIRSVDVFPYEMPNTYVYSSKKEEILIGENKEPMTTPFSDVLGVLSQRLKLLKNATLIRKLVLINLLVSVYSSDSSVRPDDELGYVTHPSIIDNNSHSHISHFEDGIPVINKNNILFYLPILDDVFPELQLQQNSYTYGLDRTMKQHILFEILYAWMRYVSTTSPIPDANFSKTQSESSSCATSSNPTTLDLDTLDSIARSTKDMNGKVNIRISPDLLSQRSPTHNAQNPRQRTTTSFIINSDNNNNSNIDTPTSNSVPNLSPANTPSVIFTNTKHMDDTLKRMKQQSGKRRNQVVLPSSNNVILPTDVLVSTRAERTDDGIRPPRNSDGLVNTATLSEELYINQIPHSFNQGNSSLFSATHSSININKSIMMYNNWDEHCEPLVTPPVTSTSGILFADPEPSVVGASPLSLPPPVPTSTGRKRSRSILRTLGRPVDKEKIEVDDMNTAKQPPFSASEVNDYIDALHLPFDSQPINSSVLKSPLRQANAGFMLVVDDAVHLDNGSWDFLSDLSISVPLSVTVIATRPLDKLHRGAFVTSKAEGFTRISLCDTTLKINLTERDETVTQQLLLHHYMTSVISRIERGLPFDKQNHEKRDKYDVLSRFYHRLDSTPLPLLTPPPANQAVIIPVPFTFLACVRAIFPSYKLDVASNNSSGHSQMAKAYSPCKDFELAAVHPGIRDIPSPASFDLHPSFLLYLRHFGQGNPRVIIELLNTLLVKNMLSFENQGFVSIRLDPQLQLYPSIPVDHPIPNAIVNMIGSTIDRLSQTEVLFLKLASVVGNVFTFNSVQRCFTNLGGQSKSVMNYTENAFTLQKALNSLLKLNILRKIHPYSDLYERLIRSSKTPFLPDSSESTALHHLSSTPHSEYAFVHELLYGSPENRIDFSVVGYKQNDDDDSNNVNTNTGYFKFRRYPNECAYVFRHGFMRDILLLRTLVEHRNQIVESLSTSFNQEAVGRNVTHLPVIANISVRNREEIELERELSIRLDTSASEKHNTDGEIGTKPVLIETAPPTSKNNYRTEVRVETYTHATAFSSTKLHKENRIMNSGSKRALNKRTSNKRLLAASGHVENEDPNQVFELPFTEIMLNSNSCGKPIFGSNVLVRKQHKNEYKRRYMVLHDEKLTLWQNEEHFVYYSDFMREQRRVRDVFKTIVHDITDTENSNSNTTVIATKKPLTVDVNFTNILDAECSCHSNDASSRHFIHNRDGSLNLAFNSGVLMPFMVFDLNNIDVKYGKNVVDCLISKPKSSSDRDNTDKIIVPPLINISAQQNNLVHHDGVGVGEINTNYIILKTNRFVKNGNYFSQVNPFFSFTFAFEEGTGIKDLSYGIRNANIVNTSSTAVADWYSFLDITKSNAIRIGRDREHRKIVRRQISNMILEDSMNVVLYSDQEKAKIGQEFLASLLNQTEAILIEDIHCHKNRSSMRSSQWKTRKVFLTSSSLHFRDINNPNVNNVQFQDSVIKSTYSYPNQACSLKHGNVTVNISPDLEGRSYILELNVNLWAKANNIYWETRKFLISFPDKNTCMVWYEQLLRVIRSHITLRLESKYRDILHVSSFNDEEDEDETDVASPGTTRKLTVSGLLLSSSNGISDSLINPSRSVDSLSPLVSSSLIEHKRPGSLILGSPSQNVAIDSCNSNDGTFNSPLMSPASFSDLDNTINSSANTRIETFTQKENNMTTTTLVKTTHTNASTVTTTRTSCVAVNPPTNLLSPSPSLFTSPSPGMIKATTYRAMRNRGSTAHVQTGVDPNSGMIEYSCDFGLTWGTDTRTKFKTLQDSLTSSPNLKYTSPRISNSDSSRNLYYPPNTPLPSHISPKVVKEMVLCTECGHDIEALSSKCSHCEAPNYNTDMGEYGVTTINNTLALGSSGHRMSMSLVNNPSMGSFSVGGRLSVGEYNNHGNTRKFTFNGLPTSSPCATIDEGDEDAIIEDIKNNGNAKGLNSRSLLTIPPTNHQHKSFNLGGIFNPDGSTPIPDAHVLRLPEGVISDTAGLTKLELQLYHMNTYLLSKLKDTSAFLSTCVDTVGVVEDINSVTKSHDVLNRVKVELSSVVSSVNTLVSAASRNVRQAVSVSGGAWIEDVELPLQEVRTDNSSGGFHPTPLKWSHNHRASNDSNVDRCGSVSHLSNEKDKDDKKLCDYYFNNNNNSYKNSNQYPLTPRHSHVNTINTVLDNITSGVGIGVIPPSSSPEYIAPESNTFTAVNTVQRLVPVTVPDVVIDDEAKEVVFGANKTVEVQSLPELKDGVLHRGAPHPPLDSHATGVDNDEELLYNILLTRALQNKEYISQVFDDINNITNDYTASNTPHMNARDVHQLDVVYVDLTQVKRGSTYNTYPYLPKLFPELNHPPADHSNQSMKIDLNSLPDLSSNPSVNTDVQSLSLTELTTPTNSSPYSHPLVSFPTPSSLADASLNCMDYTSAQLLCLLVDIFLSSTTINTLDIHLPNFINLLIRVYMSYKANVYHNMVHVFDVTHTIYLILYRYHAFITFNPVETLTILISGYIHDLGHPGTNNIFQQTAKTQYKHFFNGVLEQFHFFYFLELLKSDNYDIYKHSLLTADEAEKSLLMMHEGVMNTDMSKHFLMMTKMQKLYERYDKDYSSIIGHKDLSSDVFDLLSALASRKYSLVNIQTDVADKYNLNNDDIVTNNSSSSRMALMNRLSYQLRKQDTVAPTSTAPAPPRVSTPHHSEVKEDCMYIDKEFESFKINDEYPPLARHLTVLKRVLNRDYSSPPPPNPNTHINIINTQPSPYDSYASLKINTDISTNVSEPSIISNITAFSRPHTHPSKMALLNQIELSHPHVGMSPRCPISNLDITCLTTFTSFQEKCFLFSIILHTADISNPAKNWTISKAWSDRVFGEFLLQGDVERELGFPTTVNCCREQSCQAVVNISFIDFIVLPLYLELVKFYPNSQSLVHNIISNRNMWLLLLKERIATMANDCIRLMQKNINKSLDSKLKISNTQFNDLVKTLYPELISDKKGKLSKPSKSPLAVATIGGCGSSHVSAGSLTNLSDLPNTLAYITTTWTFLVNKCNFFTKAYDQRLDLIHSHHTSYILNYSLHNLHSELKDSREKEKDNLMFWISKYISNSHSSKENEKIVSQVTTLWNSRVEKETKVKTNHKDTKTLVENRHLSKPEVAKILEYLKTNQTDVSGNFHTYDNGTININHTTPTPNNEYDHIDTSTVIGNIIVNYKQK